MYSIHSLMYRTVIKVYGWSEQSIIIANLLPVYVVIT